MFRSVFWRLCAVALWGVIACTAVSRPIAHAAENQAKSFSDAVAKELSNGRYQTELPPSLAEQKFDLPKLPAWAVFILKYGLMATAALGLAFLIWQIVAELMAWRRPSKPESASAETARVKRRPASNADSMDAPASLEDADALAAEARWIEALRALLTLAVTELIRHGIVRIGQEKTGREIARLSRTTIVGDRLDPIIAAIEFSLFAGHPLTEADYARCRREYVALSAAIGQGHTA